MARMNDPFREIERMMTGSLRTAGSNVMDLYRSGDEFVAEVDLPGADPESIDLDIDDRTLTIRADRKAKDSDVQWLVRERATGTFARQLSLGRDVDVEKISANYEGGVLTVHMPVAEESKPRKIAVNMGGTSQVIEAE
ncbi:HSP20 family protein [Arcanobacterium wilhelmae]|uniref:HSP20 family protein n=1 Tax=Arcanobacterium wilhelmae TaxID=1803177 RepID=A0ABT9N9L6_9ACTO|nr:Hsp20/alpha crystallin family protein [Arcanobacterium wilhelmae]MDP9800412.1 HSP20 family protein [Arcanobacterium wilhelmae]WFN89838.1 Hsp20/alpha crystallin family protein [Arcanobacterium wilhelmae]